MGDRGYPVAIIALVSVVFLFFAVLILYIFYFVDRNIVVNFGIPWDYVSVSNTATEIYPQGNQVLTANGGSITRGANPDFLYVGKPKDVPYQKRLFVIFNNSSSGQLVLNGDGVTFDGESSNGQFSIGTLSGTVFFWKNKDTVVPLITGVNFINS